MNIVFAKFDGLNKTYVFEVPEHLAEHVKSDMYILVKMPSGLRILHTTSGIITGDGALSVAQKFNADIPLNPVIMIVSDDIYKYLRRTILYELIKQFRSEIEVIDREFE